MKYFVRVTVDRKIVNKFRSLERLALSYRIKNITKAIVQKYQVKHRDLDAPSTQVKLVFSNKQSPYYSHFISQNF